MLVASINLWAAHVSEPESHHVIKGAYYLIKHAAPKSNLCFWANASCAKAIHKKKCWAHQESDTNQIISFFTADKAHLETVELIGDNQVDPCDFLDKTAELQPAVE